MADLTAKRLQTQSAPDGGRQTMTMVMMIMMMMKMMIAMCFLHPKGPQTGGPID